MPAQSTNTPPHLLQPEELAASLRSDLRKGLSRSRAKTRLRKYGPNVIRKEFAFTLAESLRSQCKGLTFLFVFFTALVLYLFDPQTPYLVVLFSAPVLAVLGALVEYYSANRMEQVKKKAPPSVTVLRDGTELHVNARYLVPGDLIRLEKGALVPADLRIVEDDGKLTVLETPVSGVRSGVHKSAVAFPNENETIHSNMLYAGTILTDGSCIAMVCMTGKDTLTRKLRDPQEEKPSVRLPLALRQTREYSRFASVIALVAAVLLILTGALPKSDLNATFLLAAVLSASSLCDALLPLAFRSFSEGVYHMAEDQFLIRNPDKLERIAGMDCIMSTASMVLPRQKLELCAFRTDKKTGVRSDPPDEDGTRLLLLSLVCSDFPRTDKLSNFDRAVWEYLRAFRVPADEVTGEWFRIDTTHDGNNDVDCVLCLHNDKNFTVLKGTPEKILARCVGYEQNGKEYKLDEGVKRKLLADAEVLAHDNAYVIAIASGTTSANSLFNPEAKKRLIWRGLLAFRASVESDAAGAVYRCLQAGVVPVLSTKDPYYTAVSIGKSTGVIKDEGQVISSRELDVIDYGMLMLNAERYHLYLEPSDEQWHTVLKVRKELGHIVGVTAERQEELPLLRDADVSMVPTASCDALRESADVLLQSPGLSTLVSGVTHAKAVCLRLFRTRAYAMSGFLTLFALLLISNLIGTPAMRTQEVLFGGLIANLAIAGVFTSLPMDRRSVIGAAIPRLSGIPEKYDLINAVVKAAGAAIALLIASFVGADPTAVMLGFVLSQFFAACADCREGSVIKTRRFGHKHLWLTLPALAAFFALLLLITPLRNALGFVRPSLPDLALAFVPVILWHAAWQARLFLSEKKKEKEK